MTFTVTSTSIVYTSIGHRYKLSYFANRQLCWLVNIFVYLLAVCCLNMPTANSSIELVLYMYHITFIYSYNS